MFDDLLSFERSDEIDTRGPTRRSTATAKKRKSDSSPKQRRGAAAAAFKGNDASTEDDQQQDGRMFYQSSGDSMDFAEECHVQNIAVEVDGVFQRREHISQLLDNPDLTPNEAKNLRQIHNAIGMEDLAGDANTQKHVRDPHRLRTVAVPAPSTRMVNAMFGKLKPEDLRNCYACSHGINYVIVPLAPMEQLLAMINETKGVKNRLMQCEDIFDFFEVQIRQKANQNVPPNLNPIPLWSKRCIYEHLYGNDHAFSAENIRLDSIANLHTHAHILANNGLYHVPVTSIRPGEVPKVSSYWINPEYHRMYLQTTRELREWFRLDGKRIDGNSSGADPRSKVAANTNSGGMAPKSNIYLDYVLESAF